MLPSSIGIVWVHLGAPSCRRVHLDSRRFVRSRLVVAGFILVRNRVRIEVTGFIRVRRVHSGAQKGRRVQSGSLGFPRTHPGIVGSILVRVGLLERT